MLMMIFRLLRIVSRDKPVKFKPVVRYRVTLTMAKVKPGMAAEDVPAWLMKIGCTPTAKPNVWKTDETRLARIPRAAIVSSEKL